MTSGRSPRRSARRSKAVRIRCCTAAGCLSSGVEGRHAGAGSGRRARPAWARRVRVAEVGCMRLCCEGPLVQVDPDGPLYEKVTPDDAAVDRRRPGRASGGGPRRGDPDRPFFARQMAVVLENSGRVEPERIESYIAAGGYQALYHVLREMTPGGGRRGDHPQRPARPGRGGLPDRREVGHGRQEPAASASSSSATPTRATPARSWTAASWRATRTASWKGWPSPPTRSARTRATSTSAASTRWRSDRLETAIKQAKRLGLLGSQIFESPFDFKHRHPHRRRGLRLRRGDGADRLDRGQARHAPPAPALPGRGGPLGLPDADQQRRDVRQRPADHPQRRRLVRRHRHGEEQGHQGLRPGRQDQEHRPGRGADGDHRCGRSSRRSAAARPTAARSRRCRPAARPAAASRPTLLDTPVDYESLAQARLDHGLRRHDRHGRGHQHGRRGPLLHGVLHGRVVRQVHPLPRRHRADAPAADPDRPRGTPPAPTSRRLEELCDMVKNTSLCGLGQTAPNPVLSTLRYFRDEYEALIRDGDGRRTRRRAGRRVVRLGPGSPRPPDQPRAPGVPTSQGGGSIMAVKTLTIDGKLITAREDQTILDAATRGRHRDPDALPPRRGLRRRRLPALPGRGRRAATGSCRPASPRVAEGMEVRTDTERLREYRRMIVELLFAERNHVCSVCVANGNCELQDAGHRRRHGPRPLRLPEPDLRRRHQPRAVRRRPQPLHPLHPLRARLRRDRGGAHLGRRRPRHQLRG